MFRALTVSLLEALKPGGIMAEYLRLGSIAVLLGDCLFVHGGFHRQSMGYCNVSFFVSLSLLKLVRWLPPRYSPNTPASTASSWVLGLKEFHDKEVRWLLFSLFGSHDYCDRLKICIEGKAGRFCKELHIVDLRSVR